MFLVCVFTPCDLFSSDYQCEDPECVHAGGGHVAHQVDCNDIFMDQIQLLCVSVCAGMFVCIFMNSCLNINNHYLTDYCDTKTVGEGETSVTLLESDNSR